MAVPTYQSGAPLAPITFDGRERFLRMTLREMRDIETRLSQLKGIEVLILDILSPGRRWSMTELIVMLTTMLRHDDAEITEDYVAEHVHASNLAEVTSAIGKALNPVLPEPTEVSSNGDRQDPQTASSNGLTSGPPPESSSVLDRTNFGA